MLCEFPRCRPCSNLDVDRENQELDPSYRKTLDNAFPQNAPHAGRGGCGNSECTHPDCAAGICASTCICTDCIEREEQEEHLAELLIEAEARRAFIKETNPKDAIGTGKVPFDLVPETGVALMALGHLEGALKYGAYNYRAAGIRISVYYAAARRHMAKFWGGEWEDPNTRVPHLASSMACHNIILDAWYCGKAVDDRPPAIFSMAELIDAQEEIIAHLRGLFKDHDPRHWTIHDTNLIKEMLAETDSDHEE